MMMAVCAAVQPQPTLSKSHGYRGFSISGLPGLTQRGTWHLPLNAHVAGRVLVSRQIAKALIEGPTSAAQKAETTSAGKRWSHLSRPRHLEKDTSDIRVSLLDTGRSAARYPQSHGKFQKL